jgi:hypothetical protein
MNTDPCHKCLIEMEQQGHLLNQKAIQCLKPATHIWTPVEGAQVPLCDVHSYRLKKLQSLADTIKPITE